MFTGFRLKSGYGLHHGDGCTLEFNHHFWIHFQNMSRTEPLITPEELQCLLGGTPVRSKRSWRNQLSQRHSLHFGAAIWLVKGVFLYAVLMDPAPVNMAGSGRYLWMRGSLELLCLAVYWGASSHPRGRTAASASLLVACTTLLLDAMTLLALSD
jgi:hypothetical protein